jgi:hypothetical protein
MSLAMIHADEGQHFRNSFSNSAAFIASQQQREGDIFFNGQTGNKMKGLKDDSDALTANSRPVVGVIVGGGLSVQLNVPRCGKVEPCNQVEQRALATSAGADKRAKSTGCQLQRDPIQPADPVVAPFVELRHLRQLHYRRK